MIYKRYEIYWVNLDPIISAEINKTRPVVIVSDNMMNKYLETVVVCPLTIKLHPTWRSRLQIVCDGQQNEIAVDQIRAISKKRLYKKLDKLDSQAVPRLRQLISQMYGE